MLHRLPPPRSQPVARSRSTPASLAKHPHPTRSPSGALTARAPHHEPPHAQPCPRCPQPPALPALPPPPSSLGHATPASCSSGPADWNSVTGAAALTGTPTSVSASPPSTTATLTTRSPTTSAAAQPNSPEPPSLTPRRRAPRLRAPRARAPPSLRDAAPATTTSIWSSATPQGQEIVSTPRPPTVDRWVGQP